MTGISFRMPEQCASPITRLWPRTFDLFKKRINFTLENGKLNKYLMSTPSDKCLFNDVSAPASSLGPASEDVFGFSIGKGGTVPR